MLTSKRPLHQPLRLPALAAATAILATLALPNASAFTAVAAIEGKGYYYAAWNYVTQAQADHEAIRGCRQDAQKDGLSASIAKRCRVLTRAKGPGYGAFVCGDGGCAWTTGYGDRQEAIDAAYEHCSRSYADCQTTGISSWLDNTGFAASPARTSTGASCIPDTTVRQCRSSCTNGNCLVEYTNGCKVRVQVAPQFDPFTNQWTYPSPPC